MEIVPHDTTLATKWAAEVYALAWKSETEGFANGTHTLPPLTGVSRDQLLSEAVKTSLGNVIALCQIKGNKGMAKALLAAFTAAGCSEGDVNDIISARDDDHKTACLTESFIGGRVGLDAIASLDPNKP